MKKIQTIANLFVKDALLYKCALILMGFLYVFPFTASLAGAAIKGMLLWSGAIILYDLVKRRACFQRKAYFLLYAFVFLVSLSALLHFRENFVRNVVYVLYLVAGAVVPAVVEKEKNKEKLFSQLRVLSAFVLLITMTVAAVSFVIFLIGFQGSVTVNGAEYILGFVEGRLYGIMGNPNSSAHLAFLSIIFSFLALALFEKKAFRGLCYGNLVLQFLILSVSNSRSALVCICAVAAVYLFFTVKEKIKKKEGIAFLLALVFAFSGAAGIYAGVRIANKGLSYVPALYSMVKYQILYADPVTPGEDPSADKNDHTSHKDKDKKPSFEITDTDRDFKDQDTSNGRTEIWLAGIQVAKAKLFFGVGSENIAPNVLPHLSESTQENTPGIAANMHNVYLQVLVGSGIFSLLFFLGYFAFILLRAAIKLYTAKKEKISRLMLVLFCGVFGLLVENLFDSNIIGFMCFVIVPVFWTMCGYLTALSDLEETEKE